MENNYALQMKINIAKIWIISARETEKKRKNNAFSWMVWAQMRSKWIHFHQWIQRIDKWRFWARWYIFPYGMLWLRPCVSVDLVVCMCVKRLPVKISKEENLFSTCIKAVISIRCWNVMTALSTFTSAIFLSFSVAHGWLRMYAYVPVRW